MKTGNLLLIGVAVLGLLYVSNLNIAGNTLQYVIESFDFTSLTTWHITIMIQNVSNATINVNSMSGTISVGGTQVGNISEFNGTLVVPPNSQVPIKVTVNPSIIGLSAEIITAIQSQNGQNTLPFVIAGNVNVDGIVVPFNITQNLTV